MLDWTVEEKVLLNSKQVVVDGWRMNNQQLCACLEKLLKNQNRVLPGRLGKGFLDITSQIASGKIKACWSALMKDIEKLQDLIKEREKWEEDKWFGFLQELEVQQDRYFKTQLGIVFIQELKYKLNLIEEPKEEKKLIDDDEILPPFLREPAPEISQEVEEDDFPDAETSSKRTYFRKKTEKPSTKKSPFKKKTESETLPAINDWDSLEEKAVSEIIEWDPFKPDAHLEDRMKTNLRQENKTLFEEKQPGKGTNSANPFQEKLQMAASDNLAAEAAGWDLPEESQAAMEILGQDSFGKSQETVQMPDGDPFGERNAMEMSGWDPFDEEQNATGMSGWDPFDEEQNTMEMSGWDPFGERQTQIGSEMSGLDLFEKDKDTKDISSQDLFVDKQMRTEMASGNLFVEEQRQMETAGLEDSLKQNQATAEADPTNLLEKPRTEMGSGGTRLAAKLNANSKKRLKISKVLERTAIAIIACATLCFGVFWLRDQIARNIDKWNMNQIKIGSFGSAEELPQSGGILLFACDYGEYPQENSRYK